MPIVTSSPVSATAAASATHARKAAASAMTWSAANEPISASGSRRSMIAAARPIAAIESRGPGSAITCSAGSPSSWRRTASWCATPVTTSSRSSTSGASRSWVACSRRASGAGQVVQELRRPGARQRPEPCPRATGRHHGPQLRTHGSNHAGSCPDRSADQAPTVGPVTTFPDLLARRLRADPGRPLVTFYDDADRRAHRAVGDDLRQLGEQDREPVRRRAHARPR